MENNQSIRPNIDQYIIDTVKEKNPQTIEQLIKIVQTEFSALRVRITYQEVLERILNLQSQGKLAFHSRPELSQCPPSTRGYLLSPQAYWYWTVTALAITTVMLVFLVPENALPLVYARYLLGSIFVLFLPGYSFIKALFPTNVPVPTKSKELDNIERLALSIGMSLALVPIAGLLLNYTPWGIRVVPVTLSLLALTVTFATAAVIREHQT